MVRIHFIGAEVLQRQNAEYKSRPPLWQKNNLVDNGCWWMSDITMSTLFPVISIDVKHKILKGWTDSGQIWGIKISIRGNRR